MTYLKNNPTFLLRLTSLPRKIKNLMLMALDYLSVLIAMFVSFALAAQDNLTVLRDSSSYGILLSFPVLVIVLVLVSGGYQFVSRFNDHTAIKLLFIVTTLSAVALLFFLEQWIQVKNLYSIPIIFWMALFILFCAVRVFISTLLSKTWNKTSNKKPIVIYGAGSAGRKLLEQLKGSNTYNPIAFIDDDSSLTNQSLKGLTIFRFEKLEALVVDRAISCVVLAMPSVTGLARKKIINSLADLGIETKILPSLQEILDGKSIEKIRQISFEDLLGREAVAPIKALQLHSLANMSVCITGGGGTIGSELASLALKNGAKKLVLFDSSELALYQIERRLLDEKIKFSSSCEIIPILGSIIHENEIVDALTRYTVDTVYHAAAYKHVPLVEKNIVKSIENNVLGTRIVCQAAQKASVKRCILISTDKAVRPTNIMGATKRLAELVVKTAAAKKDSNTTFAIVRFGNVLGSSGSVIPLFLEQIENRTPITVTHPDVTRYFMTIGEAASLVVQAGSLAESGDTFVLDMGEPVKILDLVRSLVRLHGLSIKSEENGIGDLDLIFTGLRPGEKMHEELTLDGSLMPTSHRKINLIIEGRIAEKSFEKIIHDLEFHIAERNEAKCIEKLTAVVEGFGRELNPN